MKYNWKQNRMVNGKYWHPKRTPSYGALDANGEHCAVNSDCAAVGAGVAHRAETFNLDSTLGERYPSYASYQEALATTRNPARGAHRAQPAGNTVLWAQHDRPGGRAARVPKNGLGVLCTRDALPADAEPKHPPYLREAPHGPYAAANGTLRRKATGVPAGGWFGRIPTAAVDASIAARR